MEYAVTATEDVPITDLSEVEEIPPELEMRGIGSVLDCQNMSVNVWQFEEGDEIQYHAHATQEELYYALEGRFSLKLGRSGETEYREVEEGAFWVATPKIGHGHRCLSEDGGRVLAVGAPSAHDPGLDPHSLDEEPTDGA
jgi:quercetin dioxygenase-like cupin family protein